MGCSSFGEENKANENNQKNQKEQNKIKEEKVQTHKNKSKKDKNKKNQDNLETSNSKGIFNPILRTNERGTKIQIEEKENEKEINKHLNNLSLFSSKGLNNDE